MLDASDTLNDFDETLKFASDWQRNIENTIVLDIRALRSAAIRSGQNDEDRVRDDELAYNTFEELIKLLRPKINVCLSV
ncbi:uncharacterized protein N7443_003741 [Penicillium atrosanguineum]|uniref:uncharacterized protein n=1 Tax=Penicillium atrosanguineum TaxID=1132637 RepID=UPI00238529AF|nr:uncharacterized protein N7443_003741 [Penicillium atrosanguineum]KAJ5304081.1 hypothetical protein N7443_003741 [Penicillium atrosanguineum]